MKSVNRSLSFLTALMLVLFLIGCGNAAAADNQSGCPFSNLAWDATVEDMTNLEGEQFETYDSIYQGTTYTYAKEYLGFTGMIKYMYDGDGRLCNMAWSYAGTDTEDVNKVYEAVCADTSTRFGESKTDDGVGNLGQTWVTKTETIMVNAVMTNDTNVMQIAFMRADVSEQNNQ